MSPSGERGPGPVVEILYHRPPDRTQVFHQYLVLDELRVKVTWARPVELERPVTIGGRHVLEPGADAVWFTFPGVWHDIGRFHRADGTFTGLYANILTPPAIERGGSTWHTTDLYLDVWVPADLWREEGAAERRERSVQVLDGDQLEEARAEGWVDPGTVRRALAEVDAIREGWHAGRWPPAVVREWTLERLRGR